MPQHPCRNQLAHHLFRTRNGSLGAREGHDVRVRVDPNLRHRRMRT